MAEPIAKSNASAGHRILVVEDESRTREFIRRNLEQGGFNVDEAVDGAQAMERIRQHAPDLVVLDLILPGMSGLKFCRRFRSAPETAGLPVLAVSAKGSRIHPILRREMRVDDYLVKPFSPVELMSRVKALLRRSESESKRDIANRYQRGELVIDFGTREVFVEGERRELTPREFELLRFLVLHPMRAHSRKELLSSLWGRRTSVSPRTVDVHIRRLRQKLERDDSNPELILSVRKVGYRFNIKALRRADS